jgi:hypothetical protein
MIYQQREYLIRKREQPEDLLYQQLETNLFD